MSSLPTAVAHAVAFLTRPLLTAYPAPTIASLQLVLEKNLTAFYAPAAAHRCLTLSPDCLPPRAVYNACIAAGVQWFDWVSLLGARQFDLFVDPRCVSIRLDAGPLITIWADDLAKRPSPRLRQPCGKTAAQLLLEDDTESDDQIFSMIADEIHAPTWITPVLPEFPDKPRSLSPLSDISSHSRCSSRSSTSGSDFSFSSSNSARSTSASSVSTQFRQDIAHPKQSRRERARQARVYIDTSKTEVTPYDGGKTTVLTGGVMLGGSPKKAVRRESHGWRAPLRI